MKKKYLLIDFESVQPKNLALLDGGSVRVLVFLGANQNKVPVELAKAMQKLGPDAEYVQASGSGSNMLDFHIAFALGELSRTDPDGQFHVISKDTGVDPLIRHAKKKGVRIYRSPDIAGVSATKRSSAKIHPERLAAVVENLAARGAGRPRTVKTPSGTINALFQKALSDAELSAVVASLKRSGHITIEGDGVTYPARPGP